MNPIGSISKKKQHQLLAEACARNVTGELIVPVEEGEDPERAPQTRVRLLKLSDQAVLVDQPDFKKRDVTLQENDAVRIYFVVEDQHWGFDTTVRGTGQWQPSDQSHAVIDVMVLHPPEEVQRDQRRECYRLPMLHAPDNRAAFRIQSTSEYRNLPQDVIASFLLNISETGCGLVSRKSALGDLEEGDKIKVAFTLPEFDEPLRLPGEVRHVHEMRDGDHVTIGVQWAVNWDDPENRQIQEALAKFIAEQQRMALRRAR
jgi:c-di-GMP-binding flagellar brake protein YcgR